MDKTYPEKEIFAFTLRVNLTLLFLVVASLAFAQRPDSILLVLKNDTVLHKTIWKADSMAPSFHVKADSLNAVYHRHHVKIGSIMSHLQSVIDSLNHLQLPVKNLTKKLDSLQQVLNDQVNSLNEKTNDLKSKVSQNIKEIQLPPPLQENLQKLQSSIDNYTLPSLTGLSRDLPNMDSPDFGNWQLPTISKQLNLDTNFDGINDLTGNIKDLTGKAGKYGQGAQQLLNSDIGDIEKAMEGKLLNMEGAEQLRKGTDLLNQTEQYDSAALAERANEIVKELAVKTAKDHFVGKQEVLQDAMRNMMKLKNKYEEVQNMAMLPKRFPNPLRGRPFIERIIPAITFQVLKSDYLLMDINPMLKYRFHPGVAMGVGWNQRFPLNGWPMMNDKTIYGPRAALEVKWKKAISFRLLPEIMKTTIPKLVAQSKGVDTGYREWVGSLFIGIRKEYTIYRGIKGNTEVLYNLYDPDDLSPYADRIALRFGFDFNFK